MNLISKLDWGFVLVGVPPVLSAGTLWGEDRQGNLRRKKWHPTPE